MVDYADESLFLQDSVDKQISIISDDQTINISNDDIVGEEFELTESLCSEDNLRFGSVESSCIRFRVKNTFPKMMKKWLTVTITPHGAEEPFTIGRYYVRKEKPSSDRSTKEITAYDGMYSILQNTYLSWYKTAFNAQRKTTVKDFRDAFFTRLAQTHPWISQETIDLPNDDVVFKRVKKLSRRDLSGQNIFKAILEINGMCGRLGRDNVFHYYYFDNTDEPYELSKSLTISVDYEDYTTTAIDRVEWLGSKGGVYAQAGADSDNANNTYTVENNFLIRGISKEDAKTAADEMLSFVEETGFVPIDAEFKGNPCYEVGDLIQCTANGTTIKTFIMQRTMKGIQSLHDTYVSQGNKEYPTVSTTTTAKIKETNYKIGNLEVSDYALASNDDGDMGDIGYSDSDGETVEFVNSDPEYDGKKTVHYWEYNANYASPYWSTWKGVVKTTNMTFLIVTCPEAIGQNPRTVDVAGKSRQAKSVYAIGRWIGYAGSTLSQIPVIQEWQYISGLTGMTEPAYGARWNNMYNIGVTSKEYWYVMLSNGTTAVGLIDEDTPADYEYDSIADIVTAINAGDIVIDDTTASDYRMKLPTQTSANSINTALTNLAARMGAQPNNGTRSLRSATPSVSDSEDSEFIVGTNLMNDNNIKKIADTIDGFYDAIGTNIKNVVSRVRTKSRVIVETLMNGREIDICDIPTLIPSRKEPSELSGNQENNSLLFTIGTNSEIDVTEDSAHYWSFTDDGFSFDELGWWFETQGNRNAASYPNQYFTLQLDGLAQGSNCTFKLSEYVKPYRQKKTFTIWAYNASYGYEVVDVTISCSASFVIACAKYNNNTYTFEYNGNTYNKTAYWVMVCVESTAAPTMTYTQSVVWSEGTGYDLAWNPTPTRPHEYSDTPYWYFGSMEGGTVMGMLNDADMDYTYASMAALNTALPNFVYNKNFVNGKPIGVLFSDSDTVSDFSNLPTDRGTWHSEDKFHSFYADGSWHDLTCQFTATADTMYAHVILNGLADNASVSEYAEVSIKKFIETSIEFGIKKIFGKWGDNWYRYLADGGGGSTVTITSNFNAGIDVADYTIDGVGGSINVPIEANPQETASTDLTKIKIGTDVYGIQGGSGGGGYTETELYSGNASTAGNVQLSEDIGNYDEFIIWCGWSGANIGGMIPIRVSVAMFKTFTYVASPQTSTDHIFCFLYNSQYFRVSRGSDDTKIYLFDNHSGAIKKVVGIKY